MNAIKDKLLQLAFKSILDNTRKVIQVIKERDLHNEQYVLDFLDELNKLSVTF